MFKKYLTLVLTLAFIPVIVAGCGKVQAPIQGGKTPEVRNVILATTTSTVDSGLLELLIPEFEKQTGYKVKTISAGTGQALAMGEKGEADVLLVHAPEAEKKLVDNGTGINYQLVMHNDFIIVGPADDPAGIKGLKSSPAALQKIAQEKAVFISRGDKSGTHQKEQSIWEKMKVTPAGSWYQESGTGMGQTLQIASERKAYTLTDRATYQIGRAHV